MKTMGEQVVSIPIDKIILNKKLYPRESTDFVVVGRYKSCLDSGDIFPPIIVSKRADKFALIDGAHRIEAFRQRKFKNIPAIVYGEMTDREIFERAIKTNKTHGSQLSSFDLTKCILRLRELGVDKKNICAIISIPSAKIDSFFGKRTLTLTNSLTGKPYVQVLKRPLQYLSREDDNHGDAKLEGVNLEKFSGMDTQQLVEDLTELLHNKLIHKTPMTLSKLKALQKALNVYLS